MRIEVDDLSRPEAPREIGFMPTDGMGPHRIWYVGGRYAYLSIHFADFSDHVLAFELTSVLLVIAVVGTVLPSQAKSLIADDTIREGFLWNPTDAGYAMVAVAITGIAGPGGAVIGFGGRVLDKSEPKYLNSPETPVFSKGRELYGLFEARTGLRQRGYALVVEGPYRFTRNPIYIGFVLVYLGFAIVLTSIWLLLLLIPVLFILQRGVVEREEAYLAGKFGEAYWKYQARVPRWL